MKTLQELTVGDEVAVSHYSGYGSDYSFDYFVTKITATGQITAQKVNKSGEVYTVRFNNRGVEIGDCYRHRHLEVDVHACKRYVVVRELKSAAASAISDVKVEKCLRTYSTESMANMVKDLEEKLAVAKAAVAKLTEINAN